MNVVGLDFGTTNSILSFYNEQTKNVDSWKMGGVDGVSYIPSFLSIEDEDITIGDEAKENVLYGEDIESYSKFKILLSHKDSAFLKKNGFKTKTPKEVAALYIKKLLDTYKKENKINNIEKIVVSIPEIWIKDNLSARSELASVLKSLKLPNIEFKSEPVSAGAYFLHKYKANHNKDFNGHFLIFDFGGGTLDISLLESSSNRMKILERTGRGGSENFTGKAGVAFDQLVVKRAIEKQYNTTVKDDDKVFLSLLIEFEKRKISKSDKIVKAIEKYRKMKRDTSIFKVEKKEYELNITPSLLIESFDELFEEDISNSLSEIKKHFGFYNIDDKDDKKFKIVLVGGFSSFYLSQKAVMNFFNSKTLSDKRFEQDFTKDDLALSISKGAALLANDIIVEEQTYPISMGILLYTPDGDEITEVILKKGNSVVLDKTSYLPHNISTGKPTLYFDDGVKKGTIKLDTNIESLYPNTNNKDNSWNFGFSIDSNNFYYIHIKDKKGNERKTEFSHLIEDFKDRVYIQDEVTKKYVKSISSNTKQGKNDLANNIFKLEQKLEEAKISQDIEDKVNTFNNNLDHILNDIIKKIAKKNNIQVSRKVNLFDDIKILEDKLNDDNLGKLHQIRMFRNEHSHQKASQLENMSTAKKEDLFSDMNSIIKYIYLLREHFSI